MSDPQHWFDALQKPAPQQAAGGHWFDSLQAAQPQAAAAPQRDLSVGGHIKEYAKSLERGAERSISSVLRGADAAAAILSDATGGALTHGGAFKDAADFMDEHLSVEPDPRVGSTERKAGEIPGAIATYLIPGALAERLAGRAVAGVGAEALGAAAAERATIQAASSLGTGAKLATGMAAGMGAAQGMGEAYQHALDGGASPSAATAAAFMGAGVGAATALPLGEMFGPIFARTGFGEFVKRVAPALDNKAGRMAGAGALAGSVFTFQGVLFDWIQAHATGQELASLRDELGKNAEDGGIGFALGAISRGAFDGMIREREHAGDAAIEAAKMRLGQIEQAASLHGERMGAEQYPGTGAQPEVGAAERQAMLDTPRAQWPPEMKGAMKDTVSPPVPRGTPEPAPAYEIPFPGIDAEVGAEASAAGFMHYAGVEDETPTHPAQAAADAIVADMERVGYGQDAERPVGETPDAGPVNDADLWIKANSAKLTFELQQAQHGLRGDELSQERDVVLSKASKAERVAYEAAAQRFEDLAAEMRLRGLPFTSEKAATSRTAAVSKLAMQQEGISARLREAQRGEETGQALAVRKLWEQAALAREQVAVLPEGHPDGPAAAEHYQDSIKAAIQGQRALTKAYSKKAVGRQPKALERWEAMTLAEPMGDNTGAYRAEAERLRATNERATAAIERERLALEARSGERKAPAAQERSKAAPQAVPAKVPPQRAPLPGDRPPTAKPDAPMAVRGPRAQKPGEAFPLYERLPASAEDQGGGMTHIGNGVWGSQVPLTTERVDLKTVAQLLGDDLAGVPQGVGGVPEGAAGVTDPISGASRVRRNQDWRARVHESGHSLAARIFGKGSPQGFPPEEVLSEFTAAGQRAYKDSPAGPRTSYEHEGWSEFLARYVVSPETVASEFPQTNAWFETHVLGQQPELAARVHAARKALETWRLQGSAARQAGGEVFEPGRLERFAEGWKALTNGPGFAKPMFRLLDQWFVNDLGPGRGFPEFFRVASGLQGSADAKLRYMLEHGMTNLDGSVQASSGEIPVTIRGLYAEMGEASGRLLRPWATYARAKHRVAVHEFDVRRGETPRAMTLSIEDARFLVNDTETRAAHGDVDAQKVLDGHAGLMRWWNGLNEYAKQSSPTMRLVLDHIEATSPADYIPEHHPAARPRKLVGGGKANRAARAEVTKHLEGSDLPVEQALPGIINAARDRVMMAHNRLIQESFVRDIASGLVPELGEKVWRHENEVLGTVTDAGIAWNTQAQALSTADHNPAYGELQVIVDKTSGQKMVDWSMVDTAQAEDGSTQLVRRRYQLRSDVYEALTNVDPNDMARASGFIMGALKLSRRTFALSAVGLNTTFKLLKGPFYDLPHLWLASRESNLSLPRILAGWVADVPRAAIYQMTSGKHGGSEWIDAWHRLGMGQVSTGRELRFNLQELARGKDATKGFGYYTAKLENAVDVYARVLDAPDLAVRLQAFKHGAKKIGWDGRRPLQVEELVQMMQFGKQPIDYTAMGTATRKINEVVPFFAVSIGGFRSLAANAARNPVTFACRASALAAFATAVALKHKDEEWFKNLTPAERMRGIFFQAPNGQVIRIPISNEMAAIVKPVEFMFDGMASWHPFGDFARQYAYNMLPNPEFPVARAALQQIANTQSVWEQLVTGQSTPVVGQGMAQRPADEQYGPYTTEMSRIAGSMFGISPLRIDAGMRSITAGAWAGVDAFVSNFTPPRPRNERDPEPADAWMFGTYFRRTGQFGSKSDEVEHMHKLLELANKRSASVASPEKPDERYFRLQLNDATRSVSALYWLANDYATSNADRQRLLQTASRMAHDVVDAVTNRRPERERWAVLARMNEARRKSGERILQAKGAPIR